MNNSEPVQYDSAETAALEAMIAIRARTQDINSWGGPYVGDDRGRVRGYGECLEILREHLARVRAAAAPASDMECSVFPFEDGDDVHGWDIQAVLPVGHFFAEILEDGTIQGIRLIHAADGILARHDDIPAPAPSTADGAVKILADLIHFKDKGDQSVGFAASQKTWDDARAFLAARAEDKP